MNAHRGEVKFTLAGEDLILRPGFEIIAAIEAALGKPIIQIYQECSQYRAGTEQIAAILLARPGEERSKSELMDLVISEGLLNVYGSCLIFLNSVMNGGVILEDAEGDSEPGNDLARAGALIETLSDTISKSQPGRFSAGARKRSGNQPRTTSTAPSKATATKRGGKTKAKTRKPKGRKRSRAKPGADS